MLRPTPRINESYRAEDEIASKGFKFVVGKCLLDELCCRICAFS